MKRGRLNPLIGMHATTCQLGTSLKLREGRPFVGMKQRSSGVPHWQPFNNQEMIAVYLAFRGPLTSGSI
eukprot:scaffold213762_cov19-Tisochrysis_lutea.AAC.4